MKINMNDPVTVTLTAYGAKVWNARHDGLSIPAKYLPPHRCAGESITGQLWDLMHVFGPGIHLGMQEVPFLQNVMGINNAENADLQRQLADAIRERDQYKAACELADALRPLGAAQVVEGGAVAMAPPGYFTSRPPLAGVAALAPPGYFKEKKE